MKAQTYVNWGRLVVECPREGCGDAREVQPGQASEACVNGHPITLDWPPRIADVMAELSERPNARNRNWFPADHPLAVATGQPHGQGLADLKAEAKHHRGLVADKTDQVRAAMSALGLEFDATTGLVKGL